MSYLSKTRQVYLYSFILSLLSIGLWYSYALEDNLGFNPSVFTVIAVPGLLLIFTIYLDNLIYLKAAPKKLIVTSVIHFPLFISTYFVILSLIYMSGFSSEALLLWYGVLLFPLLPLVIFVYFTFKYVIYNHNLFLLIKYGLSIILLIYSLFIFSVYRLAGLGV